VHDVESFGPQVATALLSTHFPPQMWNPLLHITAHVPLTHAAVPFASVGQLTQLFPQPVGSLSAAQRTATPVPHWWVPAAHVKPQVVPLHVVALAPVGFGHAMHDVPQVSTAVFGAQMPLQSCVPVAQAPEHADAASMHIPAHSFVPVGHAGMQLAPSQVTVPPAGSWHAMHDVVPQLPTSRLLTQRPPQTW
jgi:hypothetical protein